MIAMLMFGFTPSHARRVQLIAAMIVAEFERALLAASHYENLKHRDVAETRRRRIGAGGIPRAVFETHYCE
ncbi:MAG TPA: hypothetical protein VG758_29365 [Hyphomicrobiaceae bacterium]|jgi:hypothetical protein|nr:hypothetical protein [Hyphomicrobiaceae bacterium]